MTSNLTRLRVLRKNVGELVFEDEKSLDKRLRQAKMYIRKLFVEDHQFMGDLDAIRFTPLGSSRGLPLATKKRAWEEGKDKFENLLSTMIDEIVIFGGNSRLETAQDINSNVEESIGKKVFIVHGHDGEMKESVARLMEKLNFEAIILHEHPDKGRTVIEKLIDVSKDASFAIVLLSPDDLITDGNDKDKQSRTRARQNVIFELGYFLGKLGRPRVAVLLREDENFEMLSDYFGVLYTPYDEKGAWRYNIANELKVISYPVDTNLLD